MVWQIEARGSEQTQFLADRPPWLPIGVPIESAVRAFDGVELTRHMPSGFLPSGFLGISAARVLGLGDHDRKLSGAGGVGHRGVTVERPGAHGRFRRWAMLLT